MLGLGRCARSCAWNWDFIVRFSTTVAKRSTVRPCACLGAAEEGVRSLPVTRKCSRSKLFDLAEKAFASSDMAIESGLGNSSGGWCRAEEGKDAAGLSLPASPFRDGGLVNLQVCRRAHQPDRRQSSLELRACGKSCGEQHQSLRFFTQHFERLAVRPSPWMDRMWCQRPPPL